MKVRSILPLAVVGILLALLLAVSACADDESSEDASGGSNAPVATVSPAEFSMFGGPYSFAQRGEKAAEKEREFECFKKLGLSLSEAVKLKADLFYGSIIANKDSSDGTEPQKYNFVIKVIDENDENDENVEIIVAQWKEDNDQLDGEKIVSEKCHCRIDNRWNSRLSAADTMVDLFAEGKDADPRKSPCWLDSDRKDGMLDAISKHFMLAQGVDATIDMFNEDKENNWYGWTAKKVLYAGTFEVDVQSCTLHVNGDSGTYQPKTSYRILTKVAKQFDDTVSMNEISDAICPNGIEVKD